MCSVVDKAKIAYIRFINKTNQEINKIRKEVENTPDPLLKSTYIFTLNDLIAKKNKRIINRYSNSNLLDYFTKICGETLKENETIKKENEIIAKDGFEKMLVPLKEYQI